MKKMITLSLIAMALLATGCDNKTKKEVSDTSTAVQEKATESVDNAKEAVKDATETAKDAINL